MEKMTYTKALEIALPSVESVEVREKLEALKASLEKKSASRSSKPSANARENVGIKAMLLEAMEDGVLYTITDMIKSFGFISEFSNQRVSAIVRQMERDEHTLVRKEIKRKAYFRKACADDEGAQYLDREIEC